MKRWRGLMLAGAISLATLVSHAQESNTQKSKIQVSDTVVVRMIPDVQEWDYSNLDSMMMANIKNKIYPYQKSKPTKLGINAYVKEQTESVIYDFQKFFNVPVYTMEFEADDLSLYVNRDDDKGDVVTVTNFPVSNVEDELGIHWTDQHYATITNEDKYLGYSLKTTKKSNLWNVISTNKFVRSVMIHEVGHEYFDQTVAELRSEGYVVDLGYSAKYGGTLNSLFIEEGVAEYCSIAMKENMQGKKIIPESINEMLDKNEKYNFYYAYSVYFVQDFLKSHSLSEGVRILISNPPPTNEEILKPELYFSRLKPPQKRPESKY